MKNPSFGMAIPALFWAIQDLQEKFKLFQVRFRTF